ncbi:MAG: PD-(D/E)XK nuclease family protein [Pseudomonadota bacterium]|nr:PD-(D/E)XK nuclease family protein [Pseudomonadota bacterium]
MTTSPDKKLYAFFSDPDLVNLIERVKISDDFLEVIDLTETQHSSMLAWCLNPNEGHAQGDAVLKDFLIAGYNSSAATNRFANKIFFDHWTPARVRTASFGSAFLAREFSLQVDEENPRRRLDLFIVDPANKIVITIENKIGAKLGDEQLSNYYEIVSEQLARRPVFRDYKFLYVVVDRVLATYDDDKISELGNKWALLDYTWLEAGAKRARLHIERNNEAAQMLMAYCQHQTGWESPNERQVSELAAELVTHHEEVVEKILQTKKIRVTDWVPSSFGGDSGELLIFIQQNSKLCEKLVQARGIGTVRVGLRAHLPELTEKNFWVNRTWLNFATSEMLLLSDDAEENWPLHINVFREAGTNEEASKFSLKVFWCADSFDDNANDWESVRKYLGTQCPQLERWKKSTAKGLVVDSNLGSKAAIKQATELAKEIDKALVAAKRAGIIM